MCANPSFSISRVISLKVGKISLEGGLFGRSCFSFGRRRARIRVKISSHGRNNQLSAAMSPKIHLPLRK